MSKPLVTVVTVVYNLINCGRKEQFIRALESVQNQTYDNIEHIIIDGASNDGTVDLVKEYSDKGWIKYISEPDSGIYEAMNKGATLAQGKYIIFLNSDDYFSGDKGIEKSVQAAEGKNADYSYTACQIIEEDGENLAKWHWQNKPSLHKAFTYMPFCHQTLMVKTEVFKKLGMFDLQYKSAGDYDFVLSLIFNRCKSVYVPYEFVTFQMGGYSLQNLELSSNEVAHFYKKYYSELCVISEEDCENICATKHLPINLLIKLFSYVNIGDKIKLIVQYVQTLIKIMRRKFLRIRISLKNPCLEIFGVKII